MKQILKILLLMWIIFSFTGCQYIMPALVKGGKVKIDKIEEKDIPEERTKGEKFKVFIEPAEPTSSKYGGSIPWYTPNGMRRGE